MSQTTLLSTNTDMNPCYCAEDADLRQICSIGCDRTILAIISITFVKFGFYVEYETNLRTENGP